MERRFNAEEWNALTPAERVRRCRLWAADAQEMANKASVELKQTYQNIADQWATVAREIERRNNLSEP